MAFFTPIKGRKVKVAKSPKRSLTQSKHYDYQPIIDRKPFKLPNNARVAVMPYINIEHFPAAIPGTALVPGTVWSVDGQSRPYSGMPKTSFDRLRSPDHAT